MLGDSINLSFADVGAAGGRFGRNMAILDTLRPFSATTSVRQTIAIYCYTVHDSLPPAIRRRSE